MVLGSVFRWCWFVGFGWVWMGVAGVHPLGLVGCGWCSSIGFGWVLFGRRLQRPARRELPGTQSKRLFHNPLIWAEITGASAPMHLRCSQMRLAFGSRFKSVMVHGLRCANPSGVRGIIARSIIPSARQGASRWGTREHRSVNHSVGSAGDIPVGYAGSSLGQSFRRLGGGIHSGCARLFVFGRCDGRCDGF
ncbi:hypothetical protein APED_09555 [Acanthopleuribacter pedis]